MVPRSVRPQWPAACAPRVLSGVLTGGPFSGGRYSRYSSSSGRGDSRGVRSRSFAEGRGRGGPLRGGTSARDEARGERSERPTLSVQRPTLNGRQLRTTTNKRRGDPLCGGTSARGPASRRGKCEGRGTRGNGRRVSTPMAKRPSSPKGSPTRTRHSRLARGTATAEGQVRGERDKAAVASQTLDGGPRSFALAGTAGSSANRAARWTSRTTSPGPN